MYIYTYIYVYIHTDMCECIYICIHRSTNSSLRAHIYICMYVCMYVCIHRLRYQHSLINIQRTIENRYNYTRKCTCAYESEHTWTYKYEVEHR